MKVPRYCILAFGLWLVARELLAVEPAVTETPTVAVSHPIVREVTDHADFNGRLEAVRSVNIVPRVTGYVVREMFREGDFVKMGQMLFEIDPRPYQAQYELASSQLTLAKAQMELARTSLTRDEQVASRTPGAVSQQQLDQDRAEVIQSEARVKVAEAGIEASRLNLEFCKVTSPIEGRAGRHQLTTGNLAVQDQTLLTTVVSLDPIYVYFDMDEATVLRIYRSRHGGLKGIREGPVMMGLPGEDGYPHTGIVNFINNHVDPSTGTVSTRGVFRNPLPPDGDPLMMPGMSARVRSPLGAPHRALLVVNRAVLFKHDGIYVYVVDAASKIEQRHVEPGGMESDGLRVIRAGLQEGDQVVVGGLQNVRLEMEVRTQPIPMPALVEPQKEGAGGG